MSKRPGDGAPPTVSPTNSRVLLRLSRLNLSTRSGFRLNVYSDAADDDKAVDDDAGDAACAPKMQQPQSADARSGKVFRIGSSLSPEKYVSWWIHTKPAGIQNVTSELFVV